MLSPDPPAKTDNWVNMTLLPRCHSGKESVCQRRRCRFDPWVGTIPWRRKQQPTPENSIDRGAWWAAVHGVTRSWTRLSDRACTHTTLRLKEGRWGQKTKAKGKHCHSRTQAGAKGETVGVNKEGAAVSALSCTGFFVFTQTPSTCPLLSFLCSPAGPMHSSWAVALSLWGLSENLYTKS